MSLGLIVTLTHESKCVGCDGDLEAGEMAKRVRGYGYEHLDCDQYIDADRVKASKDNHPTSAR